MHIYDKPMWLFVRGTLPEDAKPSAAVIGGAAVRRMDDRRQSISAGFWQKTACR